MDSSVKFAFNKIVGSSEFFISSNLNHSLSLSLLYRHSNSPNKFTCLHFSNASRKKPITCFSLLSPALASSISISNTPNNDSEDPIQKKDPISPKFDTHFRPGSFSIPNPRFNPTPLGFFLSLAVSSIFPPPSAAEEQKLFVWYRARGDINGGGAGIVGEDGAVMGVVLMGWLGAEQKHLRRYAELYTSRGIHAMTFVVPMKDLFGFQLGVRAERRVSTLTQELISWLSERERDGRERRLLFHTFSNTGWLAYGSVLQNLQSRVDLIEKIKGCVFDSGPDPEINPQVWASGFSAALLKKQSSSTISSIEPAEGNPLDGDRGQSQIQNNKAPLIEMLLLSVLEKFFSFVLRLPHVNQRLCRIISLLSKNQPDCPQLYFYSTADRVIPANSVELFIQEQKKLGKLVRAYNFVSSPHVDHFRSFPHIYLAELHKFLEECIHVNQRKKEPAVVKHDLGLIN